MVNACYPRTLKEALACRREHQAVPFAGGTDLMVKFRCPAGVLPELAGPPVLLGHLEELNQIREDDQGLHIGAAVPLSVIASDSRIPLLLGRAVFQMASPALRNVATLGGNIGNASPAGDAICALAALDAQLTLSGASDSRRILLSEFIIGPGKTVLRDDELITEIFVPSSERTCEFYRKVGTRKANALSKLSVCADGCVREGRIKDVRIALGAVAATVLRVREIEESLRDCPAETLSTRIPGVLEAYEKYILPIDDQRSTARYRKRTALNLVEAFLRELSQEENKQ